MVVPSWSVTTNDPPSEIDGVVVAVTDRLAVRFAGRIRADEVGRVVRHTAAQWRGARVLTYLPVLVERYSRDRIEEILAARDRYGDVA